MDGMKNEDHSGVIFKTICFFPPRSFVSSAAIESVVYCVYNEYFLRETKKKKTGRKERKTRVGGGETKEGK